MWICDSPPPSAEAEVTQGTSLSRLILPGTPQAVVSGSHSPEAALVTEHGDALAALLVDLLSACGLRGLTCGRGQGIAGPSRLLAPVAEFASRQRPEPARIAVAGCALAASLAACFVGDRSRCQRSRSGARKATFGRWPSLRPRRLCTQTLAPRFHPSVLGRHFSS